jgi:hypothetical protein
MLLLGAVLAIPPGASANGGIGYGVPGVKGGEHRLTRPSAQFYVNATSAYAQVAPTAPPGSAWETVEFDYFCDSEPNYDFLRVLVNGSIAWSVSGANQRGHVALSIGVGATVMFQYAKDGSVGIGLDTAWVDNVVFSSDKQAGFAKYAFNDSPGTLPAGWTAGGTGGGLAVATPYATRSAGRPVAQAGVPLTTSAMATTVTFPPASSYALSFRYFVDSEQNFDFLRVYDTDASNAKTQVFAMSGPNRSGTKTVALSTGGTHTFSFEYSKDVSVNVGRDDARVTDIEFFAGATLVAGDDFAGRTIGATPSTWTPGGWVIDARTPHKTYVPKQAPAHEPVVDGVIHGSAEYPDATRTKLPNFGVAAARPSMLGLYESSATSLLYVLLNAQPNDAVLGNESGNVVMWFDAGVNTTLRDLPSCAGTGVAPGAEDRQISFSYASIGASSTIAITNLLQLKYVCGSGWVPLATGDPAWPVRVAATESPSGTRGSLQFEVSVGLPATITATESRLGFGFKRTNAAYTTTYERFPYRDDLQGVPDPIDAFTWETLYLQNVSGTPDATESAPDLCCFAQSNRTW